MTDEKLSDKLRENIKEIKNNYPIFSYNDIKKMAFKDDIENGTLHISLDALQKFLNDKIK